MWLSNYLTKRYHLVQIGSPYAFHRWVLQGTVLGPLIFIVYTNDLSRCIDFVKIIMFADDTNYLSTSKCLTTVQENCELTIKTTVPKNGLVMNQKKTVFMNISST